MPHTKSSATDVSEVTENTERSKAEEDESDDEDVDAVLREIQFQNPEWLEMFLAASGLSGLLYKVQKERERRADVGFVNPNAEIFFLVMSLNFEASVAGVIVLNAIGIGLQASVSDASTASAIVSVVEHFFTTFFLVEWVLRIKAFGWIWVFEWTNFFDTVLVFVMGVMVKWFLEPAGMNTRFLRMFTVVRVLRLMRFARALRLYPQFKELWIIINGMVTCARPLLWTLVISVTIMYIFAVAGTELIGHHSDFADDVYVQARFGDPVRTLFTMFQVMTMDAWAESVARPVMRKQFGMALFFVGYILVAVCVFWNLVTAIIVENAFATATEDSERVAKEAELQKKRELQSLAEVFLEIDQDGSGELSQEEFLGALGNARVKQVLDLLELKPQDLEELWNLLDDGDGSLTIKEFSNGIRRMKGEAKAKDAFDTVKRLRQTSMNALQLRLQVEHFGSTLGVIEEDIRRIANDTGDMLGLFTEMYHRLETYQQQGECEDQRRRAKAAGLARAAEAAEAALEAAREDEET